LEAPSVQATVAWALPLVTEVMVGADGGVAGAGVALTATEGFPDPTALFEVTLKL